MIVALVEDLLFRSKIEQSAAQLGVAVKFVKIGEAVKEGEGEVVKAVLLDLDQRSGKGLEALRTLKADPGMKNIPVVAFVSHVQKESIAAARAAGCEFVLARSAFVKELPDLLRRFGG